jgi:carboxyl-terminal processing protease
MLVGDKTFGKGTVQQPEDLPGGSGLHVTIGRWLLPSGKWIDKTGVEPDVKVENDDDPAVDEQLEAAVKQLVEKY